MFFVFEKQTKGILIFVLEIIGRVFQSVSAYNEICIKKICIRNQSASVQSFGTSLMAHLMQLSITNGFVIG